MIAMKLYFYDIESLTNAFTLADFREDENELDIFYLVDDDKIITPPAVETRTFETIATERIYKKNKNFNGKVNYYDLKTAEANDLLARTFGLSNAKYINNPDAKSSYPDKYRLVCDTDTDYDENIHPYLLGYNSSNYDTTMLALYFNEVFLVENEKCTISPTTAQIMRNYNNELFNNNYKDMHERLRYKYKNPARPSEGFTGPDYSLPTFLIRKNMMMSGRHIDVARLNEKQRLVALKRILGYMGYQILESDKLKQGQDTIENFDQLIDLIAYNVSDVVNLAKVFYSKVYQSSFVLKKQLLKTYPDVVYDRDNGSYKPNISPKSVRKDRLIIDSSSAQFSTKALCPYDHLTDYDVVSFMYPSEEKAKQLGIKRVNVLDEARDFFYRNFSQPEIRQNFDAIYNYYKSIEGKNFNKSETYLEDHGIDVENIGDSPEQYLPDELKPYDLKLINPPNTCLCYYDKDGNPTSCFVNFSTGGIHGAEYNKTLYDADVAHYKKELKTWEDKVSLFTKVKQQYPDPRDLKINKGVTIDGIRYTPSTFLKPKATETEAYYKEPPKAPKMPMLFTVSVSKKTGMDSWSLNKRYAYTSADKTQHEDFTSYYPNLLRMMDAFYNEGLGYDRYGEIFDDKTRFGKMQKDEKYSKEERELFGVMRNGTKLILNSASGAGDADFESNIRVNNKIISMRIIGQIFTWRIGQAQTIAGANIPSTNTDGLYSSKLEEDVNNKVLEREANDINVEIEPEPVYLISKDSNNRSEVEIKDNELGDVISSSGSTLSCRMGPDPRQNLAHAAILDWALNEYLIVASSGYKGMSLEKPFDKEIGMSILQKAKYTFTDKTKLLTMFQTIVASSTGSMRFIFASPSGWTPSYEGEMPPAIPLQHYNRVFIVKKDYGDTLNLKIACARVVTEAQIKTRTKNKLRLQNHDPIAAEILTLNGVKIADLIDREATVVKLTGIEDYWDIAINNNDLHLMSETDKDRILDNIDYDKYLELLESSFESSWRNNSPEYDKKLAKTKEKETDEPDVPSHQLFEEEPVPKPLPAEDRLKSACEAEMQNLNEQQKQMSRIITTSIITSKQDNVPYDMTRCMADIITSFDTKDVISMLHNLRSKYELPEIDDTMKHLKEMIDSYFD